MVELSIIVSLYLIALLVWLSGKYIRLARETDRLEKRK
jgi:hypothetical protein